MIASARMAKNGASRAGSTTVLVATDFSEAGDEAIRQGAAWARTKGAKMIVCAVLPPRIDRSHLGCAIEESNQAERLVAACTDVLRERVALLAGRIGVQAVVRVERGVPRAEILRQADREGVALVVVGYPKRIDDGTFAVGSTAEGLLYATRCALLVARPSPESGAVLAATDLTDASMRELRAASEESRERKTELVVLHCSPSEQGCAAAARVEACLRKIGAEGRAMIEPPPADRAIIEAASRLRARLVVVGATARGKDSRIECSRVAEYVVRNASCSTLIVRPDRRIE